MLQRVKITYIAASVLGIAAIAARHSAAPTDLAWMNLRKVTHSRDYTILKRDGTCATGRFIAVDSDALQLKLRDKSTAQFERAAVIRITSGRYIIYSGRSSWVDVRTYSIYPTESARILTSKGEKYEGKLTAISDVDLTLERNKNSCKLPKDEISTLDVISYAPMSEANEYWAQECALLPLCLLDPALWPRVLQIGPKLTVRLFDSSLPEDDAEFVCKSQR